MNKSAVIIVGNTSLNVPIELVFVHTDNHSVIAEITASGVSGIMRITRILRKDDDHWLVLEDSLDRVQLLSGPIVPGLEFDVERVYYEYMVDLFIT